MGSGAGRENPALRMEQETLGDDLRTTNRDGEASRETPEDDG